MRFAKRGLRVHHRAMKTRTAPAMPRRHIRSAMFGVAALALGLAAFGLTDPMTFARAASDGVIEVGSDAALAGALRSAKAALTIRMKPGRYAEFTLRKNGHPVVIESLDPRRPAIFDAITISGAARVTLRNLTIERRAGQPLRQQLVSVLRSNTITLENLRLIAPADIERGREYAVMIRDGDGVRLAGSSATGMRYGVGLLNARRVTIEGNEFRALQTDGIRGGGVDDLLIAGNVLGQFRPRPGEHPDGIQLWSTNQKVPAKRITIRDNLIVRDGGGMTQGIFVRDTQLQLPFEALTIRGNLAVGTMYNGISVQGATQPVVDDNEVIAFPDQKSWIRLQAIQGGELTNNRAMQFLQIKNENIRVANNTTTKPASGDMRNRIRAWLATHRTGTARPGPYLRELSGQTPR
jgi:hypothetical protein